jgi:K+-transporting ATPase c subunit
VARVRKIDPQVLEAFVWNNAHDKGWNPAALSPVNVLSLNLALDQGHIH